MLAHSENYEYCGVLHVHSRYSDGSGTPKKIIKIAEKVGLDYIIITDHGTLQAMEDGAEGWHDDLLVLVGLEVGGYHESHYLAFGIDGTVTPEDEQENIRQYIEWVKRRGGIGFAAHPRGLHNTSFDLYLSPWDAWDSPDYTGLEIWSYMRDWAEDVKQHNILYYYFRPEKKIDGPSPEILKRWDQLGQTRRVVGIGGADAHAHHLMLFNFLKFLSYERVFRGVRTHLFTPSPLSPDLDESKKQVYSALKSGHCFFAHDSLADSTGFSFRAFTGEGQTLLMGDEAELKSGAEMEIKSPVPASLRLLRNGNLVKRAAGANQLAWKADEPGVYRVEAQRSDEPWVFTNPIYLRRSIGL
ncbi:CehA/McbA family metallohydrolase [Candidatus Poribacteria bacterium]